jgi:hypothetical protein
MTIIRSLAVFSFLACATSVVAQTTSTPPPAADTPAATTCVKPGHYPGKKASDNVKEKWINEVRLWGDCVRASVADLRAQIDKIKLANSTIEDYNAGVKELQDEQKVAETGSK